MCLRQPVQIRKADVSAQMPHKCHCCWALREDICIRRGGTSAIQQLARTKNRRRRFGGKSGRHEAGQSGKIPALSYPQLKRLEHNCLPNEHCAKETNDKKCCELL
jgi:hypothetical protein